MTSDSERKLASLAASAAATGDEAQLRDCLAQGLSPDAHSYSPEPLLHIAVQRRHVGIVRLLIEAGANVNAGVFNTQSPLGLALGLRIVGKAPETRAIERARRRELAAMLVAAGAQVNPELVDGRYAGYHHAPLKLAVDADDDALVRLLLDHGARIDARDAYGETALMAAVNCGQLVIARLLLDRGARVDLPGARGRTVLHLAVSADERAYLRKPPDTPERWEPASARTLVCWLLTAGANVHTPGEYGRTALFECLKTLDVDIAGDLLAAGADVNHRDDSGATVLIQLAAQGAAGADPERMARFVRFALDAGAERRLRDHAGLTAAEHARQRGNGDLALLFDAAH